MVASAQAQVVGRRYLLQEQIGQGGMGVVYRATDRLTGENVALKRVTVGLQDAMATRNFQSTLTAPASHPSDSSDPRVSLAQEFETLASLRHPNIISVLDYGFDDEQLPYFTMSLVEDGQSFTDAVKGKPLETQIGLLTQMLQALAYLHRRGILHRDLKPANVVVTGGVAKVLDFGLALARTRDTGFERPAVRRRSAVKGGRVWQPPSALPSSEASFPTSRVYRRAPGRGKRRFGRRLPGRRADRQDAPPLQWRGFHLPASHRPPHHSGTALIAARARPRQPRCQSGSGTRERSSKCHAP